MSDEHTVAIVSFEGALKREIKRLRNRLKLIDTISTFKMEIDVSGRTNDGEVKLVFKVAPNDWGSDGVTGRSLDACVDEMLRRHGWQNQNNPVAISYEKIVSDDTDPDEIPY